MVMSVTTQIIFPYMSNARTPAMVVQMSAQDACVPLSFWLFLSIILIDADGYIRRKEAVCTGAIGARALRSYYLARAAYGLHAKASPRSLCQLPRAEPWVGRRRTCNAFLHLLTRRLCYSARTGM